MVLLEAAMLPRLETCRAHLSVSFVASKTCWSRVETWSLNAPQDTLHRPVTLSVSRSCTSYGSRIQWRPDDLLSGHTLDKESMTPSRTIRYPHDHFHQGGHINIMVSCPLRHEGVQQEVSSWPRHPPPHLSIHRPLQTFLMIADDSSSGPDRWG